MSNKSKLGYFFPYQESYSLKGYVNTLTSTNIEQLFLTMNTGLTHEYILRFTINDLLKKYFNIKKNHNYFYKIDLSSEIKIDFKSKEWNDNTFILDLGNMIISGTNTNNIGRLELYNIENIDSDIITKYYLFCYLYKDVNTSGYEVFNEEFLLEEYIQTTDEINIITMRRIENYSYDPDYTSIFNDMLDYLEYMVNTRI